MNILEELKQNSQRFNKIVIWGLRSKWHTHRFIFQAYYRTLKKSGVPVIWVDDNKKNVNLIEKGDLIFSAGVYGKMVPEKKILEDYNIPIRDDVFYCPHFEKDFFVEQLKFEKRLKLEFYNNFSEQFNKISEGVNYNNKTRTLYQFWGTNLMPHEFKKPFFRRNRFVFWVGSIWNDKNNHGNLEEIAEFKRVCRKYFLRFYHVRFVPDFVNVFLIRLSRIAPAIGGRKQVEINYLPCRMFKNISYGQLGFSNVEKFNDIFKDCNIYDKDIDIMTKKVLDLNKEEYINLVKKQQEICKKYTIAHHLNNIFKLI